MSMNKIVNIPLETTAYYQSLSKLNVQLWNQDKNTAELRFLITRNNFPLPLSGENVKVILTLESGDSFISTDDLDIENEVEGVATYIIPEEFMKVATSVVGQIYVTTIDGEEIVVQRKFSFEVAEDLLSTIPSEDKIRYIKMFDDLKEEMSNRLDGVTNALSQLESNIDAVNNARETGITAINNLYNAKLVTFNQNFDDKMALINGAIEDLEEYADTTLADMTTKKEAFDASVTGSGLITTGQTDSWQKYKLTNEDGTRTYLTKGSFTDVHALEPGYYETVSNDTPTQGFPSAFANNAYIEIDVLKSNSERKQITVTQSSRGQTFVKFLHIDGEDNGWKEVAYVDPTDAYEKVSGSSAKANTAENNAKVYTDARVDQEHSILFSGSVNGVNNTVNLTGSMNDYEFIIISGDFLGNDFSQIVVPSITGSVVNMQNLNLRDTDGMLLGVYEVRLEITSTTIKITNDVAYDKSSDTGSGPNRNAYTIIRVEGVHKK